MILWILPKAPTACDTCGAPVREHGPKKPLDEMHFLDREHFFGSRIRAESDGILTTLYLIRCDGKISDSFLLLDSDCEAIRDALDEHLHRKGIR